MLMPVPVDEEDVGSVDTTSPEHAPIVAAIHTLTNATKE